MGFRFTLESANTVANLTCGRINSCYDSIFSSHENYLNFIWFLDNFTDNMYTDHRGFVHDQVHDMQTTLHYCEYERIKSDLNKNIRHSEILHELQKLSLVLNRCRIKSLLLPRLDCREANCSQDYMTSSSTLNKLLHYHPSNTCLILQPQERPNRNRVTIFDAFPNFDVALKQIDLWPAVLFWDENHNFAFVPISCEKELIDLYDNIRFEYRPINYLQEYANGKKVVNHYYFHLSDLHFGTKNTDITERRLKSLIKTQISTLNPLDKLNFIITGDAVDSPSRTNNLEYLDFAEFLESRSGEKPIFVLGNHDINRIGLALNRNNQILANSVGKYPQIHIDEDIKVVFLLFNSNTNGYLAEGEIGLEQMSEMGNLIDNIPDSTKYKYVAVLHHHITYIKKPNFYNDKWYVKMIGRNLIESSLRLRDAEMFLEWLKNRNIKLVLHGHKHIPFICQKDGIQIIACGSSTGQITHIDSHKTYMSYNLLKFTQNHLICTQFVEEVWGSGAKDINTVIIQI